MMGVRATGVGRARPADDFRGMHGPDPGSCERARSTREVAHLLRRRDVARDLLLLRKLVGDEKVTAPILCSEISQKRRDHVVTKLACAAPALDRRNPSTAAASVVLRGMSMSSPLARQSPWWSPRVLRLVATYHRFYMYT